MDKLTVKEFDSATGEEIVRDMTEQEIAEHKAMQESNKELQASIVARESSKAALLERLGITAEEAALLLA
jgi:hypothetical protein